MKPPMENRGPIIVNDANYGELLINLHTYTIKWKHFQICTSLAGTIARVLNDNLLNAQ